MTGRYGQPTTDARTFLFVPGSRRDLFDKAVGSGADLAILDLEDAVAPDEKATARRSVADWLAAGGRAAVRVNGADTEWFAHDLEVAARSVVVVVPKAESPADLALVAERAGSKVPVVAMIETAKGVMAVAEIAAAPNVVRLAFGNVDLAADIGVEPTSRAALATARSLLVYASRAAGIAAPIDGVTTKIDDSTLAAEDAVHGHELGFTAKLLIHPKQVEPVVQALAPPAAEVSWARVVLGSFAGGVGVHDGQMIDEPVLVRAREILRRSERVTGPT